MQDDHIKTIDHTFPKDKWSMSLQKNTERVSTLEMSANSNSNRIKKMHGGLMLDSDIKLLDPLFSPADTP